MTLDEAIKHCEEVAKEQESHGYCDRSLCVIMDANNATCDECEAVKCRECASEHRQLAEWLKELKAYRNKSEIPTSCGDAISRQAAIDAMYELCDTGETLKENPWRDNPHIDAITDAIDDLPSVTPQQRTGRWIPVSERLPEEKGTYLVTQKAIFPGHILRRIVGYAHNLYDVDEYDFADKKRPGWYEYDSEWGYRELDDVIAWMPLPKPYRAESEE